MFKRMPDVFCLVHAVMTILDRHYTDMHRVPGEPLGRVVADNGRSYTIQGQHVKKFLHRNIDRLMAHSLRVTAAVALHNA